MKRASQHSPENQLVFVSKKVHHQLLYILGRMLAVKQLAKRKKAAALSSKEIKGKRGISYANQ